MDSTLATYDLPKITEKLEKLVKNNGLAMKSNDKTGKTGKNHMLCCDRLKEFVKLQFIKKPGVASGLPGIYIYIYMYMYRDPIYTYIYIYIIKPPFGDKSEG